jgi:hypothetical protein
MFRRAAIGLGGDLSLERGTRKSPRRAVPMKEELFHDALQILDYCYLCKNVNNFAKSIFSFDESKYKKWAHEICELLKKSKSEYALDIINKISPKLRKINFQSHKLYFI